MHKAMKWLAMCVVLLALGAGPAELSDPRPQVRTGALDKIARESKGNMAAMLDILDTVNDPDPAVRQHAVNAIGATGGIECIHLMKRLAASKGEPPGVKSAAQAWIKKLGKVPPDLLQWDKDAGDLVSVNGQRAKVPPVDLGFESSQLVTFQQRMSQRQQAVDVTGQITDPANVQKSIQWMQGTLHVGSYGRFYRASVVEVNGPNEMLIAVKFDGGRMPEEYVRVAGFPTAGLVDDSIWAQPAMNDATPKLVIVDTANYTNTHGASTTVFRAVPAAKAMLGMTVEEFNATK